MSNQILVTNAAKDDIRTIVRWSLKEFGAAAALRYSNLIEQAIRDLRDDPMQPGSKARQNSVPVCVPTISISVGIMFQAIV